MERKNTVAVLGTGLLGSGMVENLLAKGHPVRVWNRSRGKLAPLVDRGAVAGDDPAATVAGCDRVHLVLAEDGAVDAVVAALRPGLGVGVPILDHSTNLPARVAARSHTLAADGIRYLHAPVFMSPQNAREASGLMLIAGPGPAVEPLLGPLGAMTGKVWHCGERPDLAAVHKLAGNAVLIAMTGVMGDLLQLGAANGVDAAEVLGLSDVFKAGAALPFLGQRVRAAGEGAPSVELGMARKDVRLMLDSAGQDAELIVLPAIAATMDRAIEAGLAARDFAVFARPGRPARSWGSALPSRPVPCAARSPASPPDLHGRAERATIGTDRSGQDARPRARGPSASSRTGNLPPPCALSPSSWP